MSMTHEDDNAESSKPMIRIDRAHPGSGSRPSPSAASHPDGGSEPALAGAVRSRLRHSQSSSTTDSLADEVLPGDLPAGDFATEQLLSQAGQLARHLQDRRRDVDCREAQLNARIAQLESDLRLSRLWLREQGQEFAQREEELQQQLSVQESRAAGLAVEELALHDARREFAEETRVREDLLARREFQVQESQQRLAAEAQRLQTERELAALERQHWDEEHLSGPSPTERALAAQLEQLQQQTSTWQREREEWQQESRQQQQAFAAERESFCRRQRRWGEEREQQQQVLEQERQHHTERQATLERVRAEVLRLHRESLEMRLVTEQLWAQLAGRAAPDVLMAGLGRLRSQLSDELRLATQDLESQQTELQALIGRLEQKHREVTKQRRDLMSWLSRRQSELAEQTTQLSQREKQLALDLEELRHEREKVRLERLERAM